MLIIVPIGILFGQRKTEIFNQSITSVSMLSESGLPINYP